jgi:hypothetical protein
MIAILLLQDWSDQRVAFGARRLTASQRLKQASKSNSGTLPECFAALRDLSFDAPQRRILLSSKA